MYIIWKIDCMKKWYLSVYCKLISCDDVDLVTISCLQVRLG